MACAPPSLKTRVMPQRCAAYSTAGSTLPSAAAGNVCVSWRHFQEERWRIDEAGIKEALAGSPYTYVSADAQGDPQKQPSDIEGLIAGGCAALIVLAQDSLAIVPAIEAAKAAGIPVIAYDVPVDTKDIIFISFDNVRDRSLRWIWEESSAFQAFRGDKWMQEPCRSCERRFADFGGCRCQAMALAGDPAATDPVCSKSPLHAALVAAAEADADAVPGAFTYRRAPAPALTP